MDLLLNYARWKSGQLLVHFHAYNHHPFKNTIYSKHVLRQHGSSGYPDNTRGKGNQGWRMPGANHRVTEEEGKDEICSNLPLLLSAHAQSLRCYCIPGTNLIYDNMVASPSRKAVCDLCYLQDRYSCISVCSEAACNLAASRTLKNPRAG